MNLTFEQQDIVYCDSPLIFVSARAGTGKTTTLVEFVKVRKSCRFLYIVYNNSMKEEALLKFPSFVEIHTSHSLAYSIIGIQYKEKIIDNLRTEDIFVLDYFKNKNLEDYFELAYNVHAVINRYCNSTIDSILNIPHEELVLKLAEEYWQKMIDKKDLNVNITHDGYLKLFSLSKPKLDYDYIMVDEVQDSNEIMFEIAYSQEANKIFIGDEHQRIYGFRGALNVFNLCKDETASFFSLTKSFRFGEEIAKVGNVLLSEYKKENILMVGTEDRDSVVGEIDKTLQYTVLTRTNARLFDLAVEAVLNNKKIHIIGGADFIFNQILDGYYLYKGETEKIKSKYIKKIKNYTHLKALAKNIKIPEHILLVRVIDKYKDSLKEYIELIKRNLVGKKQCDIILSTAHKSKGLEFVSVVLSDDYISLYDENGFKIPVERIELEEINLLYVAITRATHELELNYEMRRLNRRRLEAFF